MTTRKKYPKEFKLDAISLVLDQEYTRAEAARSLEINPNLTDYSVVDLHLKLTRDLHLKMTHPVS